MPVHAYLSSHELRLLDTYKQKVEQWGWRWQQHDSSIQLTASGCVFDTLMGSTDLQVVTFTLCFVSRLRVCFTSTGVILLNTCCVSDMVTSSC